MQRVLKLPTGSGVLKTAFRAVKEKQHATPPDQGVQIVELYANHFTAPASPCSCKHEQCFERFSLVDPNVRTVVGSTTETPG